MWCAQRRQIGWLLMALALTSPSLWLVLGGARAFAEDATSVPSQAGVESLAAAEDEGPRVRIACTPPATEFLGTLGEAFARMPEAAGMHGIEFLNAWGPEDDRPDVVCLFGTSAEAIDAGIAPDEVKKMLAEIERMQKAGQRAESDEALRSQADEDQE